MKYFELSNHASAPLSTGLGNVLTTISDRKIEHGSGGTVEYYTADIISATDYYPFGFAMDKRNFSSSEYRFGFNGMEKDDEFTNSTSHYDFGARIYDSRLGRFLSVDPLMKRYAFNSPYCFAANNPLVFVDNVGKNPEDVIKLSLKELDVKLGYSIRFNKSSGKTVITKTEVVWDAYNGSGGNKANYTIVRTTYFLSEDGELESASKTKQNVSAEVEEGRTFYGAHEFKLIKNDASQEEDVKGYDPINEEEKSLVLNEDELVSNLR
jgi:RHS repeat-associated protein